LKKHYIERDRISCKHVKSVPPSPRHLPGTTGTGIAPVGYTAAKELFSPDMAGISIGAVNFFPFFGGVVAQPLIGVMLDRAGKIGAHYPPSAYKNVMLVYFVISLLGVAAILFSRETIRKG
jgi:MFS family permease